MLFYVLKKSRREDTRNHFYFSCLCSGNSSLFSQKWWRRMMVINMTNRQCSLIVRVYFREIPDYENHLKFASEKVKTWLVREIYYRWLIIYLALEKCTKKSAIPFKLFWYKVFVHWILKLLNFVVDSVSISFVFSLWIINEFLKLS